MPLFASGLTRRAGEEGDQTFNLRSIHNSSNHNNPNKNLSSAAATDSRASSREATVDDDDGENWFQSGRSVHVAALYA